MFAHAFSPLALVVCFPALGTAGCMFCCDSISDWYIALFVFEVIDQMFQLLKYYFVQVLGLLTLQGDTTNKYCLSARHGLACFFLNGVS